jgi:hypothetical protein
VAASTLTATAVRYLFASTWAQPAGSGWTMHVPGAKVDGPNTAANLLNIAVWSLREQGLVEVQQLRPVEAERVVVMGGRSFARVAALGRAAPLPGLEGALLAKAQESPGAGVLGKLDDALAKGLSGDDEQGLRGLVLALGLSSGSPWNSVAEFPRNEAREAGVLELKGRLIKRPVISDPTALEALKERDAEILAARTRYREQEPDLDGALISDCLAAVSWAHNTTN